MAGEIGKVELHDIEKVGISHKKKVEETGTRHITKISFEVEASPSDIGRLLYFCKQEPPADVTFMFPEAKFDFALSPVDLATGEIVPEEIAKLM